MKKVYKEWKIKFSDRFDEFNKVALEKKYDFSKSDYSKIGAANMVVCGDRGLFSKDKEKFIGKLIYKYNDGKYSDNKIKIILSIIKDSCE